MNAGSNVEASIDFCYQSSVWQEGLLHLAVARSNAHEFRAFLIFGFDVNKKNSRGRTALHILAYSEKSTREPGLSILDMLLATGADVDARDRSYKTPLHIATVREWLELIDILLRNGASVYARDSDDQTPLHYASRPYIYGPYIEPLRTQIYVRLVQSSAEDQSLDKRGEIPRQLRIGSSRTVGEIVEESDP